MSLYATNEYIISSNNSMNENKYNTHKASKSHKIKSILKPLLRLLRKSGNKKAAQQIYSDFSYEDDFCTECDDNSANEELESKIFEEIENCQPDAAIFVCDKNGEWNFSPVEKKQAFVPVHFARTDAGTFFWTSASSADSDVSSARHCYTECQAAAEQRPVFQDRWVQA